MSEKDKIREELEGLSPLLARMKDSGRQPFRVPEGYFKELPDEVLRRARAEEGLFGERRPAPGAARSGGLPAWLRWLLLPRQAVGLAMAVVLIAAGAYLFWPRPASLTSEEALAGISREEAEAYVSENIGEFGLELMVEAAIASGDGVPEVEILPDVGEEEIDRYLDEYLDGLSLEELEELL